MGVATLGGVPDSDHSTEDEDSNGEESLDGSQVDVGERSSHSELSEGDKNDDDGDPSLSFAQKSLPSLDQAW
jgi:hypothetical protein